MQLTLRTVHCCELCALKQKPGVLLENTTQKQKKTKSQLQTVLITASGPQAYNALAHRERYTQGSRQIRCVSSQEALALRASVSGTGKISDSRERTRVVTCTLSGVQVASRSAPSLAGGCLSGVWGIPLLPLARWIGPSGP